MLAATLALLALGLILQWLVPPSYLIVSDVIRQSVRFLSIGIIVMLAAYFLDVTILAKYPKTMICLLLAFPLCLSYFFPWHDWHDGVFRLANISLTIFTRSSILFLPLVFATTIYVAKGRKCLGLGMVGLVFLACVAVPLLHEGARGLILFILASAVLFGMAVWKKWFGIKRRYCLLVVLVPLVLLLLWILSDLLHGNRLMIAFAPGRVYDPDA